MDPWISLVFCPAIVLATVIPLPDGASTHGRPNLLCKPADGHTVLAFFLSNYVTHAASTQTFTTQPLSVQFLDVLTSFMLPTAQISKILHNISRGIIETFGHKHGMDLTKWTVVRKEGWIPVDGHTHPGIHSRPSHDASQRRSWKLQTSSWSSTTRLLAATYHNFPKLPPGYGYAPLPSNALVITSERPRLRITRSVSSAKIVLSVFQTISSTYALYYAKGDEIAWFGYAAFSLTVAPYTVMSVLNLIANLVMPDFKGNLVHSEVTDELERRFGKWFADLEGRLEHKISQGLTLVTLQEGGEDKKSIDGVRAVLVEASPMNTGEHDLSIPQCADFETTGTKRHPAYLSPFLFLISDDRLALLSHFVLTLLIAVGIPLAVVGGLSFFEHGSHATVAQYVWTMLWLAWGWLYALGFIFVPDMWWIRLMALAPAIGGFVVVGQMIVQYGQCLQL